MGAFTPTDEQATALDLFTTGQNLAIEAGAGTGKTSTLVLLAESDPIRRGQYVAFNRAIVNDAGAKLPGNVKANTAHSLAFAAVGKRYADRLKSGRMRGDQLARILDIRQPVIIRYGTQSKILNPGFLAGHAMRAITIFCQTADPEPTERHIGYIDGIDLPDSDGHRTWKNNDEVRRVLAPALRAAWDDLQRTNGALPFKHEHYLKMWQLSRPTLGCDFVLFDEAQDASPVMLAVINAQEHAQRVFVGDSNQAIYGFTGAVDAIAQIKATGAAVATLTQSFRFGPAVADVANRILVRLASDLRLRGLESIPSTVSRCDQPDAILTRTNAVAVEEVLSRQAAGEKPHLVGGGSEVATFAKGAQELQEGGKTWLPDLACFDSWSEVQAYVEHDAQGGELKLLVKLVDNYGAANIREALERMPTERAASTIVSTSHKAKGREWERVQLAGDYPEPGEDPPSDEELRLLYVAATRARVHLDITAVALLNPRTPPPAQVLPTLSPSETLDAKALTALYGGR